MFAPHSAQINVQRTEPEDIEIEYAIEKSQRRNSLIAAIAIKKYRMKPKRKKEDIAKREIAKKWNHNMRLPFLENFISTWNYWREFYDPKEYFRKWEPKSKAQLTLCENIVDLCKTENIDLNKFIACGFKAFSFSKFSLSLQFLYSNGIDIYDRHIAQVDADIDQCETDRMSGIYG